MSKNTGPSQAKPIGVGNVTFTHDLTLQIGLDLFSEPVDIYVALYAPAVFSDMFLFRFDGNLTPLSLEFSPWRAATSGPVNEVLLGTIPLSLIPSGDYTFYLIAAPAGTKAEFLAANCYIWGTSVGNLRVLDVSKKAASLFGGDVEGAAAILMALGRNHDIENVAKALLDGRLTQYGSILATAVISGSSLEVTGLSSGSATITVEDTDGETASISVTVSSPTTPSGNCGAYVAPSVWKQFDCCNLAAIGKTTGDDLMLPATGYRFHLFSGALYHRGSSGYYWSSSEYGSFNSSMAETSNYYRRSGHAVRYVTVLRLS